MVQAGLHLLETQGQSHGNPEQGGRDRKVTDNYYLLQSNLICFAPVCVHKLTPALLGRRFELLEVLTFDSVRRRMSVIVRSGTGIVNLCPLKFACFVCLSIAHSQCISCPCVRFREQASSTSSARAPTPPYFRGSYLARWTRSERVLSTTQW